jgi:hypothetical protein
MVSEEMTRHHPRESAPFCHAQRGTCTGNWGETCGIFPYLDKDTVIFASLNEILAAYLAGTDVIGQETPMWPIRAQPPDHILEYVTKIPLFSEALYDCVYRH